MKTLLFPFLFLFSISFKALAICACERVSLAMTIPKSTDVFRAKVVGVSKGTVTLKQINILKGKFIEKIKIGTGSCSPTFKVGDDNFFYLTEEKIETNCDNFFPASNEIMSQQLIKLL